MGTRHLTIVKSGRKIRVAQYGQWDGYPTGAGSIIQEFLKKADLIKFQWQVENVVSLVSKKKDIDALYAKVEGIYGSDKAFKMFPEISRDTGAGILNLIHEGKLGITSLVDSSDFAKDNIFCEYVWIINLDKQTVSCRMGGELTKRWLSVSFKEYLELDLKKIEEVL